MRDQRASPDAAVATLAAAQHGVVSRAQLIEAGIQRSSIARRVQAGRLHPIHRGVYAVGHPGLGNEGRWLAAVLACGDHAALSHRSAAQHWGLLPPSMGAVEVTIPGHGGRAKRPGIKIHRSRSLTEREIVIRNAIRVTIPARTLLDLRRVAAPEEFRKAVREAEVRGYGMGGVEVDHTRSELEYLFLRICRRHRLPEPEVNVRVGPFLVDFVWRAKRLIVETDGRRYHRGSVARMNDQARDERLSAMGYRVLRFGYREVARGPADVAMRVRHAMRD